MWSEWPGHAVIGYNGCGGNGPQLSPCAGVETMKLRFIRDCGTVRILAHATDPCNPGADLIPNPKITRYE